MERVTKIYTAAFEYVGDPVAAIVESPRSVLWPRIDELVAGISTRTVLQIQWPYLIFNCRDWYWPFVIQWPRFVGGREYKVSEELIARRGVVDRGAVSDREPFPTGN